MKLSELIEKHGNKEVDEQAVINMLGLKVSHKPERRERYWYVADSGDIHKAVWENDKIDNFRYSQGNCFATKKEAETYKRVLETESKLRRYAKKHNEGEIEWDNAEQIKYSFVLDISLDTFDILQSYTEKNPRMIYFTSDTITYAAIEEIGKEAIMEYLRSI